MHFRNQSSNIKAELASIILNLRQYISSYDLEIDHERHLGSELPMLDPNHSLKLSKCYSLVRPTMPRDTFYASFLKGQRELLLDALKAITINSQFAGTKVRPPIKLDLPEDFLDNDAALDINYALPVDLEDSVYLDEPEPSWTPGEALRELDRIARNKS